MIEHWLTEINPKAILRATEARCEAKYAVYVVEQPEDFAKMYKLSAAGASGTVHFRRIQCG